ncbi:MAG: DoxX family protein [Candidatus Sungbacteria bacterium]|uniref:DoxX family protein n=1 Tax=Candidatus Sungiibacteriota bacterium TaxID=2750080 RepID=A0A932YW46_9BACT|nr:DoxX family protein [Candidatus Sungbacteria bacterium]
MFDYFLLYQDWGPLILRVTLGVLFMLHGYPKLFTPVRVGFGGWLESIGIRPGKFWALVVGVVEFFGGAALILGVFIELAALLIAIDMLVAMIKVKWGQVKVIEMERMGWELDLIYFVAAVSLLFSGPGAYALGQYLLLGY